MSYNSRAARNAYMREWNRRTGAAFRNCHGPDAHAWFASAWEQQDGRCYLCGEPLTLADVHVDHDHRCCPPSRSCPYCRRGLAHSNCNHVVGFANDDPELLRRIAGNLEAVLKSTEARLAAKPSQEVLYERGVTGA